MYVLVFYSMKNYSMFQYNLFSYGKLFHWAKKTVLSVSIISINFFLLFFRPFVDSLLYPSCWYIPDGGRAGETLEVGDEHSGQGHEDGAGVANHRLEHVRPVEVVGQLVDEGEHHGRQHRVQQHWTHLYSI